MEIDNTLYKSTEEQLLLLLLLYNCATSQKLYCLFYIHVIIDVKFPFTSLYVYTTTTIYSSMLLSHLRKKKIKTIPL